MKNIFFLLAVFTSISAKGQLRELRFDPLSVENGLPENYAVCSLQDHLGYIWIGTQNGLVRYDGYEVKVYKLETSDKKERNLCFIRSLFEDSKGNIWIGTFLHGLFLYDRFTDKFTEFSHGSAQLAIAKNEEVLKIVEDKNGFIWTMNSARDGMSFHLDKFDPKSGSLTSFDSLGKENEYIPARTFNSLLSDSQGNIWLGSNNGLYIYKPGLKKFRGYFTGENIQYIYEAPSRPGTLWLSQNNINGATGLTRFDKRDGSIITYRHTISQIESLLNDTVFAVFEDHEKRLWIGTAQGLSLLEPQTGTFTSYKPGDKNTEADANNCYDIKEDRTGALWILSGKRISLFIHH